MCNHRVRRETGGGWGVGYYGHRKSTAAKFREIHAGVNMGLIAVTLHICRKPQEPAHSVCAGTIARVYYNIHIPAFLSKAFPPSTSNECGIWRGLDL